MKHTISKSLIFSSILLCSSLAAAQDKELPGDELDMQDPDYCVPFPSCAQVSSNSISAPEEKPSEWSTFWEKLSSEIKVKVRYVPLPTK